MTKKTATQRHFKPTKTQTAGKKGLKKFNPPVEKQVEKKFKNNTIQPNESTTASIVLNPPVEKQVEKKQVEKQGLNQQNNNFSNEKTHTTEAQGLKQVEKQGLKQVEKGLKQVEKRFNLGGNNQDTIKALSKTELEIIDMHINQYVPVKVIARVRNCTVQAVYKTLRAAAEKGLYNPTKKTATQRHFKPNKTPTANTTNKKKVEKKGGYSPNTQGGSKPPVQLENPHEIRLHGEQFSIGIVEKHNYTVPPGTCIEIDGNKVYCWRDKIDVYSNKDFWGKDADETTALSCVYWTQIFTRIENTLKISLIKERKENIIRNKAHYAEINNEIAQDAIDHDYKIKIRSTKDGMVWALCDFSKKTPEFEAVHPTNSKNDMQDTIAPIFNDLRDNPSPLPSVSWKLQSHTDEEINKIAKMVYEIGAGLATITKIITPKLETKPPDQPDTKKEDHPQKSVYTYMEGYV